MYHQFLIILIILHPLYMYHPLSYTIFEGILFFIQLITFVLVTCKIHVPTFNL
jgi:hypothetical protein